MDYEQKNSNLPMFVKTKLRHGGCYERYFYYLDLDRDNQSIFAHFYHAGSKNILSVAQRLGNLHRQENHHRHLAICRSGRQPGSRCLSSILSRRPMEHGKTVAASDENIDPGILSKRPAYAGSGQHAVSSQRQKNQRSRLLARCRSFDQKQNRVRLGTESGSVDLADSTTLGRRTIGAAHQHAFASQKGGKLDRIG